MNRSIAWVGIGVVGLGMALVAFPIAVYGAERLDPEQLAGFLVAPVGLFVVLIAAVSVDPYRTTVPGAFGNKDEAPPPSAGTRAAPPRAPPRHPAAAVHCRYCRSMITADLAQCPRCARARDCHGCRRPLGLVLDRPTCPTCARAEAYCNCPYLAPSPAVVPGRPSPRAFR